MLRGYEEQEFSIVSDIGKVQSHSISPQHLRNKRNSPEGLNEIF
jgi:hypothetical protein